MSAATTRLLREMTRLFREAAPIRVASERDTSSAL
jgi:hypothetical protein